MTGERNLRAAWVYDEAQHVSLNSAGRNYWHVYTAEILDRLGLTADAVPPSALSDPAKLREYSLLFIGRIGDSRAVEAASPMLRAWVHDGGTLVGFAAEGLEPLFGVEAAGRMDQPSGEFSIAGYLRFVESSLTAGLDCHGHENQPLIIVSPIRMVAPTDAEAVAALLQPDSEEPGDGSKARATPYAAVSSRTLGRGRAFYFAFDLPQTMWTIHQGRPVDADHDGDGYLRAMDARVIGGNDPGVAYTDELHFLLQAIIGTQPMPLIHQIPPLRGEVADALFFFGGDDEGQPKNQVAASDFMKSRGLPYHINLMPVDGEFALSRAEMDHVERNGHELSLHYDFITGFEHPTGFTEQDVRRQVEMFRPVFGRPPVCSVNHWCRWTGWADPARWMSARGQIADNSWMGAPSPPLNPVNTIDFSFGTAFPRHVWDDWRRGNERLDFVQEHVVAYEVGYREEATDFERLHQAVDRAARYRLTVNMFYHPVYLATNPACQRAIDELLGYVQRRGIAAAFMGNDELARWWLHRSDARLEQVRFSGAELRFHAECDYPDGFVAKVCIGRANACQCAVSGAPVPAKVVAEFGANWAYIPLPQGGGQVLVRAGHDPAQT